MEGLIRWTLLISGGIICALAYQAAWQWCRGSDGLLGPSIILSNTPWIAALVVLGATVVGGVVLVMVSRMVTTLSGMAVIGAGLGWSALGLADLYQPTLDASVSWLVVDGLGWAMAVFILSVLAFWAGGSLPDVQPLDGTPVDPLRSPEALRLMLAGAAALPLVWMVAVTAMRGQSLGATVIGGMAAGIVGRLISPNVQPILLPMSVVLWGAGAMWVSGQLLPSDVAAAWSQGNVTGLLFPAPVDWAVGGLLGVPIGFRLAGWFLHHEESAAAA